MGINLEDILTEDKNPLVDLKTIEEIARRKHGQTKLIKETTIRLIRERSPIFLRHDGFELRSNKPIPFGLYPISRSYPNI